MRGYQYEKGKFVVLNDDDFSRVDVEATQTVDIQEFVEVEDINPMFFSKPYHMEPGKGGDKAYTLLREVLRDTGKVGIAKVVIKTREHLAALHRQMFRHRTATCPFESLPTGRSRWGAHFTGAELARCTWVEPRLVAQIRFAEWTEDAVLRQPAFVAMRADKPARRVVREV